LIRAGLQICIDLQYDYAVVLGRPKCYLRFGFQKASGFGLQNGYGVDAEFMAIKLRLSLVPLVLHVTLSDSEGSLR
jgi:putative acetyltransferase